MISREKVYSVVFMEYTNCMNDTVSTYDGSIDWDHSKTEYLDVSRGPFLVRESELEKYRKYGRGFREIIFVGWIETNNEIPNNAKWEINPDGYYPYCSNCKEEPKGGNLSEYCPKCGAKMESAQIVLPGVKPPSD